MTHDPQLVKDAQQHHQMGINELTQVLPNILSEVVKRKAWKGREKKGGGTFSTFYEFATAPLWQGLGLTGEGRALKYEDAIRYCAVMHKKIANLLREQIPALAKQGGTGANQHASKGSDATSAKDRGATYLARRLKRDAPEIAAALARGEYRSARQAAIAAGIVKEPTPLKKTQLAFLKLDVASRQEFDLWRATQGGNNGSP